MKRNPGDRRPPPDTRPLPTNSMDSGPLHAELRKPYSHPGIRQKAHAVLEDIDNWRACINAAADRYGWSDWYVRDGLRQVEQFEDLYAHLMAQLA